MEKPRTTDIGTPRRIPSLRSLLIVLIAATVVPISLLSAWLIVLQSHDEMEAIEDQLLNTAQAIAIDVDREVAATIHALQTLALGFDLDTVRAREFQELSNRMLITQQAWKSVIVRDPSGKPLVTVSRQTGEAPSANFALDERLDFRKGEKAGGIDSPLAYLLGSSVGVHVPIRIEQKVAYLVSVLFDPQLFAGVLTQHKVSPDWLVSILDPKKIVVASTRFAQRLFGKPTQFLSEDSGHSAPGHLFPSNVENVPSYVALSTAPVSQWSVVLAVPASVVEAPYYRTVWIIVGMGLLCLIAGVAIAYLVGRKVARPLERLAADAKDRARGKSIAASPNGAVAEVASISEAFDQSAHLLKEREQERDYLSDQLDVRFNDLTGLHQLTTSLLAIEERQILFDEIVKGALFLLTADRGTLHLMNQTARRPEVVAQIGATNELAERLHFQADTVMAMRRPLVIEDIEHSSIFNEQQREAATQAAVYAAISFPLTERGGELLGALSLYFAQPFKLSRWQEILIDLYAQYCVPIIEQMQAKEELRTENNDLEERVKDHARKLEQAYLQRINDLTRQKELEKDLREAQKMELVGTLAGGVAHDFNNILNIILSYASSLETKKEKDSTEHVEAIKEMVQRGASVVKQLLAVARRAEPQFEATDLNALIRRLMDLLAQTFPKDVIMAAELDPQIPPIMLDSNQISQAVINLCVNARDAMPNGGKLTIRTQHLDAKRANVRFAGAKDISYGCVAVSDTGTGIENEAKEHVFEPFFTTKGPGRGTGLGLSVVYGIMQTHEGLIHFNTESGRGTTFYLCFPIREAAGLVAPARTPPEMEFHSPLQGATILIVEDEPNQLILLRRVFEKKGYTVLTAAEGHQALEIFSHRRNEIAVVLLDVGLPGINGWEVFRKMKEIDPEVKVVFATGYVLPEIDLEKVKKDSCGVVMKPYDVTTLQEKIADTIGYQSV